MKLKHLHSSGLRKDINRILWEYYSAETNTSAVLYAKNLTLYHSMSRYMTN